MKAPSVDIAYILQDAGVGIIGAATGWAIFADDHEPPSPDQCITLYNTGGTANSAWVEDYPSIQVRIRGAVGDYQGTWAKAEQVKQVLLAHREKVSEGAIVQVVRVVGDIVFLEYDAIGRPIFTCNFQLSRELQPLQYR